MMYEPAEDSYLLAEQVRRYAFGNVLDVGTGSGIQAQIASELKKVASVLAVDIDADVVKKLKKEIKNNKIKVKKSDLFSTVKGRFHTIVFNPPYLPYDRREPKDSQLATTGGKHGYEVLGKFLLAVNDHLAKNGICLIVFSSLTNKAKIDELLDDSGLESEQLSEKKIGFETLYVYKIQRNWLLKQLFDKHVINIKLFAKGHRGVIFTGMYKGKKISIKAQRLDVVTRTVEDEAEKIARVNKKGIAPKLLFKGKDYFAYRFIEGELIKQFLEHSNKKETKRVILEVLRQCRVLDVIHFTKKEMTNPYKHVIVGKKTVLVDFERAHYDQHPQNVTQFCQYILRNHGLLSSKGMSFKKDELIALAKHYKNSQTKANYNKIKSLISAL